MDDQAHGYAVGAFNVEDMEMIQAVIAAAEAEHALVLPQTTPAPSAPRPRRTATPPS